MSSHTKTSIALSKATAEDTTSDANDLVWGGLNIGREINRSVQQFYYLYEIGALKGAVTKLGHKTFVGSRRKLRALFPR
jgi:hypothetical protein